jgi:hypothetical protein
MTVAKKPDADPFPVQLKMDDYHFVGYKTVHAFALGL